MVESLRKEIKQLSTAKATAEAKIVELKNTIAENEENYSNFHSESNIEKLNAQHADAIDRLVVEKQVLDGKLTELKDFKLQKTQIEAHIKELEATLEKERNQWKNEVQEVDRYRIAQNEKLKRDMMHKLKQTKHDLIALNDEQLHTSTKLTILENHRLTQELEFQSKHIEKLVKRNNYLEDLVKNLKRDIDVHKEVESELAKRSKLCQKIIRKLSTKIKEIEGTMGQSSSADLKLELNEEVVPFLEQKLEEAMNNYTHLQNEFKILQSENEELKQGTTNKPQSIYLAQLLADYLKDLQSGQLEITTEIENLQNLVQKPVEYLTKQERQTLPYINETNLIVPDGPSVQNSPRSESVFPEKFQSTQEFKHPLVLDRTKKFLNLESI